MKIHISIERIAFMTGFSLILMTVIAGMTMGLVFNGLFTTDLDEFKIALIGVETSTYNWGLVGWFLILGLDIFVSWGVYQLYKRKNNRKALLSGMLRLIYSAILAIALIDLVKVSSGLTNAGDNAHLLFDSVQKFYFLWHLGLIVFGLHLLFLAKLVCEKKVVLRIISVFLLLAGLGYIISNTVGLWIENYEEIRFKVELVFILPMIFGELGWGIWLMIIGAKGANLKG